MMKKQTNALLAGLLVSVGCMNTNTRAGGNEGFIAGACAVGAALFAAAGVAAVADWCFSETDDQLIVRIDAQYRDIHTRYNETMSYFGQISGLNVYAGSSKVPYHAISESVLHEFATQIWYKNSTQYNYRSAVMTAKNDLQSSEQKLCKRIRNLESKSLKYEDQQRLRTMRQLLNRVEELSSNITLFADALEYHKSYFNLYDSIDTTRNKYLAEITILESGSYSMDMEIKRSIVGRVNSQFALRSFVIDIKADINALESRLSALAYNYPVKRQYAQGLVNVLVAIKNIVVNDSRYQQELYEWEQARLRRLQLDAMEAQARAERERVNALREQNRILEERNRIEREKARKHNSINTFGNEPQWYNDTDIRVIVDVTI